MNDNESKGFTPINEYMTVQDVMNYLHISEPTVYRYFNLKKNPLPSINITRGKTLVKKSDLDIWLESYRRGGEQE